MTRTSTCIVSRWRLLSELRCRLGSVCQNVANLALNLSSLIPWDFEKRTAPTTARQLIYVHELDGACISSSSADSRAACTTEHTSHRSSDPLTFLEMWGEPFKPPCRRDDGCRALPFRRVACLRRLLTGFAAELFRFVKNVGAKAQGIGIALWEIDQTGEFDRDVNFLLPSFQVVVAGNGAFFYVDVELVCFFRWNGRNTLESICGVNTTVRLKFMGVGSNFNRAIKWSGLRPPEYPANDARQWMNRKRTGKYSSKIERGNSKKGSPRTHFSNWVRKGFEKIIALFCIIQVAVRFFI